jgi:hypothetical protein
MPSLFNLHNSIHITKCTGEKHERVNIFEYFLGMTPEKKKGQMAGEPGRCDLRSLVLEYGFWIGGKLQSRAVPNAALWHLYAAQRKPSCKRAFTGRSRPSKNERRAC